MAPAYQAKGGSLHHNAELSQAIVAELEGVYAHSYNERMAEKGNWWFWEFGIPLPLEDAVVLMHDSLASEQIARYMRPIEHFLPSPATSTGGGLGANGAWSARVCTLKSILLENADGKLSSCRNKFNELMQYVANHDGYYSDGSYVGYAYFAYTGGGGVWDELSRNSRRGLHPRCSAIVVSARSAAHEDCAAMGGPQLCGSALQRRAAILRCGTRVRPASLYWLRPRQVCCPGIHLSCELPASIGRHEDQAVREGSADGVARVPIAAWRQLVCRDDAG